MTKQYENMMAHMKEVKIQLAIGQKHPAPVAVVTCAFLHPNRQMPLCIVGHIQAETLINLREQTWKNEGLNMSGLR